MRARSLRIAVVLMLLAPAAALGEEPRVGDNGLHVQEWFLESFLDLREDAAEAARQGKRLVILWEQRGCPSCRDLHRVHLANAAIAAHIRTHFEILQLDLRGARKVVDLDGVDLPENELARKHGVRYTPTVQFLAAAALATGKPPVFAEVVRMPGLLPPGPFLAMFRYVQDEAWRHTTFRQYLERKPD